LKERPVLWWVFAPLACDVEEQGFEELLHELKGRVQDQQELAEFGVTMRVLAERNPKKPGLAGLVVAVLTQEVLMQSEFLKQIEDKARQQGHDAGRKEGREEGRQRLLHLAAHFADADALATLAEIEDLAVLEGEVLALIKRNT